MPQDMVRSRRAVLFYHHVMSEEIRRRVQPLYVPKITVSLNKQVIMCVVLAQNLNPWEDAFCVGMTDRSEQNLIFSPKKRLVDITPACSAGPPFLSAFKLLDFLIFILCISFYYVPRCSEALDTWQVSQQIEPVLQPCSSRLDCWAFWRSVMQSCHWFAPPSWARLDCRHCTDQPTNWTG